MRNLILLGALFVANLSVSASEVLRGSLSRIEVENFKSPDQIEKKWIFVEDQTKKPIELEIVGDVASDLEGFDIQIKGERLADGRIKTLASDIVAVSSNTNEVIAIDDRQKTQDAFRAIWSPYCKGYSLWECPSPDAQKLRDKIRARMANGESEEAVFQSLLNEYGQELRMMPAKSHWTDYLPYALFALVVLSIIVWLKKKVRAAKPAPSNSSVIASEVPKELLKDLDRELKS